MAEKVEWKERKVSLGGAIVISVAMVVVGILIGVGFKNWNLAAFFGVGTGGYDINWSELDEIYGKINEYYDGDIDKAALLDGAKAGLVDALGDKYTVYMDAEKKAEFNDELHGNVGAGVGIEMGLRDKYVRVLRTLPDNPARKAGILAGDIIYKVNGEEVYDLSTEEISQKVRGEAGTEVTVTVVRDGEELSFTMTREVINNVSAYVVYDGSTAIVTVTRFDQGVGIEQGTGAIVQGFAKEFASRGVDKVILDLRNNGGGYVSAARELLSLWVDGEPIVIQKSKHSNDSVTYAYSGRAILKDMKTVVLVNGATASASEITAGALQDYGKATILGETTYGKGVVQELFDLRNSSMLKVTTASWYTPKDRSINKTGIVPDVVVEMSYDDINAMRDPQMEAAKKL